MSRDRLILLQAGFADAAHPGDSFVCPDGLPIEGLLASAPEHAKALDVERVPYPRPRAAVVAALDEAQQGLPVLILGSDLPPPADAQRLGDTYFVNDTKRILTLLAQRHGFPKVH